MAGISNLNNSFRLGGNEAPPAVMSVFLGSTLTSVLDSLEKLEKDYDNIPLQSELDIIGKIPSIRPDNTDRNRTSPFAFTGNRFEFRAVGSSTNVASAMYLLNAAVTQQLVRFKNSVDDLMKDGLKKEDAFLQIIRTFIIESKNIRFEGNGYSQEWQEEARSRGLKGVTNVPEAGTELRLSHLQETDLNSEL
jgi:glutamine synthetase